MLPMCDICGSTANVHWWMSTAARVCNLRECSQEHQRRWDRGRDEELAKDEYAREMGTTGTGTWTQ